MIHRHLGAPPESGSPPAVLKKGSWSAEEDRILIEYVRRHGEGNWNVIQRNTALQRCGKSCRLRWTNHLRPNLKKGAFSSQEERLILDLHSKLGNKWARISAQLPGRTDNEVKNYWNTRVRKRLRQGLPLYPYSPPQQPPVFLTHLKTPLMDLPFPPPFFSFTNTPGLLPHVDLQPPIPPDLDFDYKLELPSNPNVIHTRNYNSGLLDALLQEAHTRGATATATHNLNKEDCLDGDKRDSVYANSSPDNDGGKMEEQDDDDMYYRIEDLSSIFNLIPSLVKQPKENNGNHHQESSNGQSSNVSEDNTKPEFPSNTEWLNTSTSYTSWDNLPSIW